MRRIVTLIITLLLLTSFCGCSSITSSSETEQPSESAVESSAVPTEEPTPEPTAELTLDAEGTLDGMTYKYNTTWKETSDPLTNATLRTYDIDLGSAGTISLQLVAVNDEGTSAAVQNLRTQGDADREAVINSMITAKDGTLTESSSQRADTPPSGTRAMWAYEGKTEDGQSVHGYSYVGGSQLYEVSVIGSDETYAVFEPTWKSLINQLTFQEIEPIETPEPTPEPTQKPTATPLPESRTVADPEPNGGSSSNWMSTEEAQRKWENEFGYYDYTYSYSDDERYITFDSVDDNGEFYATLDRATGQWVWS